MFKCILSTLLFLILLLYSGTSITETPIYTPVSLPIKINNVWYSGIAPVKDTDGTLYFPLNSLVQELGIEPPVYSETKLVLDGHVIEIDPQSFIEIDGLHYLSCDKLSEGNFHVYYNENSKLYIDNFPLLDYSWANNNRVIAHAAGGYLDRNYTNSREAFIHNYERGFRVFEIDFLFSSDNVLLALHDWDDAYKMQSREVNGETPEPLTAEEYKSRYLYESMSPMTIDDVMALMMDYPDVRIITDTKSDLGKDVVAVFQAIIQSAQRHDPAILDRFIPQLYNTEMYDPIFDLYNWKSAILTLYQMDLTIPNQEIFDFIYQHGIKAVVCSSGSIVSAEFSHTLSDIDGYLYLHTYNSFKKLNNALENRSVYGIYTDHLEPTVLDGLPRALLIPEEML